MITRTFTAVDSSNAAEALRKKRAQQSDWPYVHLFPPPNSITVHQISPPVAVPAKGARAVVLSYQVPTGFRFFMPGILESFSGGAFNPGDLLWTVTVNQPTGIADTQGAPVQGLVNVPVPLGSWTFGTQWPFVRPYEFDEDSVVRSVCLNSTGNVAAGAPNLLVSGFFGFLVPTLELGKG